MSRTANKRGGCGVNTWRESSMAGIRQYASSRHFTDLTVALDLRNLPPGTYFLATTHEGDPSSYFYPLTVQ